MKTLAKSIPPTAPMIGKAGELRVRSELILRGFSPAVCDQDDGVDIILVNNGNRIQVKTATKPVDNKNYGYKYSFNIRQPQVRSGKNGFYVKKQTKESYRGIVDYFIFYCVKHNLFYILPEDRVAEKTSLVVPTPTEDRTYRINDRKSKSKYEVYKNAWHLLR